MIYLDNAATTKLDEEVLTAMIPYLTSDYGNASSIHFAGTQSRTAIEKARKTIADLSGVKPHSIIFTSGGTESNNMAILSAIRDQGCNYIITSSIEHHAVLYTTAHYAKAFGIGISYVSLYEDGSVNLNDLEKKLQQLSGEGKKCLVSLMNANNETGQLTEINWAASACKKYGAIFHSDCVQTIGHYPINLLASGVHFASASAHKFHGPKGIGFLYADTELKLQPLIFGGGQERGLRSGTENVAAIVGMATALELFYRRFNEDQEHIESLKQYMAANLITITPGTIINSGAYSLYSILNVSFPKTDKTEFLLMQLNDKGIFVSGGSACSLHSRSHVMNELNRNENYTTIRFSFSKFNSQRDIEETIGAIRALLLNEHSIV